MREIEPELRGLAHHLRMGGETFWTSNALTVREASSLLGIIRHSDINRDRRRAHQHDWQGPERRRDLQETSR